MDETLQRLHPGLRRWIELEAGWSALSPIQRTAIPPILDGHDCVIEAPTAGGKTEAVLFPTLTRAASQVVSSGRSVRVLYLAPLRALLNNLEGRGELYAERSGLRAFKWHGDVAQKEKLEALRDPPELLLTTPESLEAILLRKATWKELFADLATVIVDEAHNFAAGDRGGHLLCLLERLGEAVAEPFQRIALSATVGNPEAMLRWLAGPGREAGLRLAVAAAPRADRDIAIHLFDELADVEGIEPDQQSSVRRFAALHRLVARREREARARTLVFVRSRRGAENLAKAFKRSNEHRAPTQQVRVRTHHSAVSKFFREEAESLIQDTSEDGLDAILSTSTLELGIDIGELSQVIQVDALASPSSFLQRVGRTGRRPGKPQWFRGLVTERDDLLLLTATVSLGLQGRSEALLLPRRAFHLLAHQLICLSLQSLGVSSDRAWRVLSAADCFSAVSRSEFDALVDHMLRRDYLRLVDGALLVGEATEKSFLHSNWRRLFAVFDSAPLYEVFHGRQQVGTLDAGFVEGVSEPESVHFVLGGKLWRVVHVDTRSRVVRVTPSREGSAPAWISFGGPDVPFETAQEAGRLLCRESVPEFLDDEAGGAFRSMQVAAAAEGWGPGQLVWTMSDAETVRLITFAGDRINRTLARLFALSGLGKATANFYEVRVKAAPEARAATAEGVEANFARLRSGPWSEAAALETALRENQKLLLFSAFARCLPEPLWAAALVERTLDPVGLIDLVQRVDDVRR